MSIIESLADAVLTSESDAIVAADRDGVIRFWNPGAERIFGYSNAAAVGQSLDIIIPEAQRQRHWEGYHRVLNGCESRYGSGDLLSVPAVTQDGTRISVEFTIVPLHDENRKLIGLAAIMRDTTKRFDEIRVLQQRLASVRTEAG